MSHLCAICRCLFRSSDEVLSTNCGHIFHSSCLTEWLNRSKTCPQCREATDSSKIHRIYLNISSNDVLNIDAAVKREDFDCLDSRICRMEVKINAFTEQVECYQQFRIAAEKSREEANALKIQLKNLRKTLKALLKDRESNRLIVDQLKKDLRKTIAENNELQNEVKQMKSTKAKKDLDSSKLLKKKVASSIIVKESSSESKSREECEEIFPYNLRNRVHNLLPGNKRKITHSSLKNAEHSDVSTKISRPNREFPMALTGSLDDSSTSIGRGSSVLDDQFLKATGSGAVRKTNSSINKSRAGHSDS